MNKENMTYIHSGITYSSPDGTGERDTEEHRPGTEKTCVISLIWGTKKNDISKKQRLESEEGGGGMGRCSSKGAKLQLDLKLALLSWQACRVTPVVCDDTLYIPKQTFCILGTYTRMHTQVHA